VCSRALMQERPDDVLRGLCRVGAVSAFILLAYCVEMMLQITFLGGQPSSAAEAFQLLEANRLVGLLRLDLPTIFALPLYYLLFLALSAALWQLDGLKATISALLVFTGVTLTLATPMALSMVPLSAKYAAATTDAARNQFLAAGEAVLAADMWHGTGAYVGGLLVQCGAVLICVAMIRSSSFTRLTGWLGIVIHGLDLLHLIFGLLLPKLGAVLMVVAGMAYPVWFILVGRDLLRLARGPAHESAQLASTVG
jgi:hypothetical protein